MSMNLLIDYLQNIITDDILKWVNIKKAMQNYSLWYPSKHLGLFYDSNSSKHKTKDVDVPVQAHCHTYWRINLTSRIEFCNNVFQLNLMFVICFNVIITQDTKSYKTSIFFFIDCYWLKCIQFKWFFHSIQDWNKIEKALKILNKSFMKIGYNLVLLNYNFLLINVFKVLLYLPRSDFDAKKSLDPKS